MSLLVKNISSNFLLLTLKMASVFMLTPIMIRNMGNFDYGLWELICSVIGYMGLLDLGLTPAISRFISKYTSVGDRNRVNTVLSSTFFFFCIVGVLSSTLVFTWGWFFSDLVSAEKANGIVGPYQILCILISVQLLFLFPSISLVSTLEGLQKFEIKNRPAIINTVVSLFIIMYIIDDFNALLVVAFASFITQLIKNLFYLYYVTSKKRLDLKIEFALINVHELKTLLVFGFKSFVQGASNVISNHSDNIIISFFIGIPFLVFFTLPKALFSHLKAILGNISIVFLPYFTSVSPVGDGLTVPYLKASKLTNSLSIFATISIAILGNEFILFWIGEEYARASEGVLYILAAYALINFTDSLGSSILTSMGKHGYMAKVIVISQLCNVLLSIFLAPEFGIEGVALATLLTSIFARYLITRYRIRVLNCSLDDYLKTYFSGLFVSCVAVVPIFFGQYYINNIYELLFLSLASVISFLSLVLYYVLDKENRKMIINFLKKKV